MKMNAFGAAHHKVVMQPRITPRTSRSGFTNGDTFGSMLDFERLRPYTVTVNTGLDKHNNSISLVPGVSFTMPNKDVLEINESSVTGSNPRKPVSRETQLAEKGLDYLIRIANNMFSRISSHHVQQHFYEDKNLQAATIKALEAAGIDIYRPFDINGTRFQVVDGVIRKIHTKMGEYLAEDGIAPVISKYEHYALLNHIDDLWVKSDETELTD
jgi:hypothetical protein